VARLRCGQGMIRAAAESTNELLIRRLWVRVPPRSGSNVLVVTYVSSLAYREPLRLLGRIRGE
jgi:hypothetical protein